LICISPCAYYRTRRRLHPFGLIHYGAEFQTLYDQARELVQDMRDASTTSLLTLLLSGTSGAHLA
jgi:hypothetical protein